MRFLRVMGDLVYEDIFYCDCRHCDGHGSDKSVTIHIDMIVRAENERQAISMVQDVKLPHQIDEYEWAPGPTVLEPPTDQVMYLIGAPMLPQLGKLMREAGVQ